MTSRLDRPRKAYEFLSSRAADKAAFTIKEIAAHAGWQPSSAKTYITKLWLTFLIDNGGSYSVKESFLELSFSDFFGRFSQKRSGSIEVLPEEGNLSHHPLSRDLFQARNKQKFQVAGGRYELRGKAGDGAAGLVRWALCQDSDNEFAVKFLAPDPKYIDESAFDDVAARFRREGEKGAKLRHPFLLKIYAYCENKDGSAFEGNGPSNPFLLMERLQKGTLEDWCRKRKQGDESTFSVGRPELYAAIQLLSALNHLHSAKTVHRDVKPGNIFLEGFTQRENLPRIKLGDFGIVKWSEVSLPLMSGHLTATNQKGLGTQKYMSPEQARDPKTVGVRSDVYSLGVTLFELFTSEILATPLHVFSIVMERMSRGSSTLLRLANLGYKMKPDSEEVAGLVLDMFHRSPDSRPATEKILRRLEWQYETGAATFRHACKSR